MEQNKKNLPFTFVFDRPFYAGGATFAALLEPLFEDIGGFYYNYSEDDADSIRTVFPKADGSFRGSRPVREEDVNFLWGLSLRQRMGGWSKPTKYITMLRHPVLRFISFVRTSKTYDDWGCFWESGLWDEDVSLDHLETFVDRYLGQCTDWRRSQCAELLGCVDYGGMEWMIAPAVYPDNTDPLREDGGLPRSIEFLEREFSDVYILELQEESAFHFALKHGFAPGKIQGLPVVRHDFYSRWDELDIPRRILRKIERIVRDELVVYHYFRKKLEADMLARMDQQSYQQYVALKYTQTAMDGKMARHFLEGDTTYVSQLIRGNNALMQSFTEALQRSQSR